MSELRTIPPALFGCLFAFVILTYPAEHRPDQQQTVYRTRYSRIPIRECKEHTHKHTHLEPESPLPCLEVTASPPPISVSSSSGMLWHDVRSDEIQTPSVPLRGSSDVARVSGSEVPSLRKCMLHKFPQQQHQQPSKYHTECRVK